VCSSSCAHKQTTDGPASSRFARRFAGAHGRRPGEEAEEAGGEEAGGEEAGGEEQRRPGPVPAATGTMRVVDADGSRGQLEEERARLQELRTTFEKEGLHRESEDESLGELSHLVQHQADVGTETFNRERDMSILERVEAELGEVEHALHRLDDGTYGKCEACGKAIDDDRLQALPAARFCLQDQTAAEREARATGERS